MSTQTLQNSSIHWSVVIPAFNEAARIGTTLTSIQDFAKTRGGGEVLVVDDGSTDETSQVVQEAPKQAGLLIQVIRLINNQGKGAAVRRGVYAAHGDWILIMDADGSVAIPEVDLLLPHLAFVPVVIGSKYLDPSPDTSHQDWARTLIARGGNLLVRWLFRLTYADTQCGFKLLSKSAARELFSRMVINRWGFDIELLACARRLNLGVREIPIRWTNTDDSRVSVLPAAWTTLRELAIIRWRLWWGFYRKGRADWRPPTSIGDRS